MKKPVIAFLILLFITLIMTACSASRKNYNELKGLMLLDNVQLQRNSAYFSKHNNKLRKSAFKKNRKNSRIYNARKNR